MRTSAESLESFELDLEARQMAMDELFDAAEAQRQAYVKQLSRSRKVKSGADDYQRISNLAEDWKCIKSFAKQSRALVIFGRQLIKDRLVVETQCLSQFVEGSPALKRVSSGMSVEDWKQEWKSFIQIIIPLTNKEADAVILRSQVGF